MKNRFAPAIGLVSCAFSAIAFGSIALQSSGGPFVALQTDGSSVDLLCVGNCPGGIVFVDDCSASGGYCCGWVNCSNPSSYLRVCCDWLTQDCINGLQTDPPGSPQCVNVW